MGKGNARPTYLQTLGWYVRRPQLYRHLLHLCTLKQVQKHLPRNRTAEEASTWCRSRAVDTNTAVTLLTGSDIELRFAEHHPAFVASAQRAVDDCPFDLGGAGNLDLLYNLTLHLAPASAIETGVAYGWSALAILSAMSINGRGTLVSTDLPMPFPDSERWVGAVVPDELRERWHLVGLPDRLALPTILHNSTATTLCHYDSDKTYHGRMWAYDRLWQCLEEGGVLVSDDVSDNLAFHDFARDVGSDALVVEWKGKFQGVLRKSH